MNNWNTKKNAWLFERKLHRCRCRRKLNCLNRFDLYCWFYRIISEGENWSCEVRFCDCLHYWNILYHQPRFIFENVNLGSLGDPQENSDDYENVNINNETEPDNIQCVLIVRNLSHEVQIENSTTCSNLNKSVKYPNLNHTSQEYMGYILVIVYKFSQGLTVFLIRGTPIIEVSYDVQLLWSHIVGFLVSLLFMFIFESSTLPDDIYNVMYLTGHVTLSFLATVTYFVVLNFASGVLVTLNYSSGIVLSMLSQYFIVYNVHPGHRNLIEIGGAVLILLATCMNPVYQLLSIRLKKDQTSLEE